MEHYEGVRQPLDTKPPHLIADFKFHIDRVNSVLNVPKELYDVALPTVKGVEGRQVIVSSTPEGSENFYYKLYMQQNKLPITAAILSWGSHETLKNTLKSYKRYGLLDMVGEVIIFFQETSERDLEIAKEFGIENVIKSPTNIGIGPAIKSLAEKSSYDNFMFLEMDWVLIEDESVVRSVLEGSVKLIEESVVDFYRLRSRINYGYPLYTSQFQGRELDSPEHLIEQVHFLGKDLSTKFPELIKYTDAHGTETVYGDSRYCNYSNNPFICKKQFWLDNIAPSDKGGISLEGEIRGRWMNAGHKVGYNIPGLFTHHRIDR